MASESGVLMGCLPIFSTRMELELETAGLEEWAAAESAGDLRECSDHVLAWLVEIAAGERELFV